MRFAGFDIPQVALLGLGVVAVALLLGSTRWRLRRSRTSVGPTVREQYEALSGQASVTRDIEEVMLELDRLSRQIHGRLDTKLAKLEMLLRDADERIDQLSRLQRSTEGQATLDVTLQPEHPDALELHPSTAADTTPAHADIYRLADSGASPLEIARQLGQSTGEIELVLSLRKAKARTADKQPRRARVRPGASAA